MQPSKSLQVLQDHSYTRTPERGQPAAESAHRGDNPIGDGLTPPAGPTTPTPTPTQPSPRPPTRPIPNPGQHQHRRPRLTDWESVHRGAQPLGSQPLQQLIPQDQVHQRLPDEEIVRLSYNQAQREGISTLVKLGYNLGREEGIRHAAARHKENNGTANPRNSPQKQSKKSSGHTHSHTHTHTHTHTRSTKKN